MQKIKKKKHARKSSIALLKAAQRLAVHTESFFPSTLCLESSAPFSVALRLAHIETQAQIALRQLTALAALTFASSRLISILCPQRAVLTLSGDLNQKHFRDTRLTMYHHHQQQPGPQSFPSGPPPNQPPVRPPTDMMPPPVGAYQFPRPTQLPEELESALSIRGSRDMDHRLIEHLDRLSQLQNQAPGPAMGQHGNYGTNPQPKQQPVDWSSYEPPTKLFSSLPSSTAHTGTSLPNWNPSVGEASASNPRGPVGRSFYTPESAGTILASFGLSNEDLEALSHYPDDQLTPDTLPFILRDLQVHKTGKPKTASSRSPEVPSLLTVTQTEGRVIDYGHASQAKDESGPPKSFKKEPISSERTVKMYPTPAPKLEAGVGRQVRLEPPEPIKHGDRDYRRRSSEHHASRSPPPPREFSTKPRHQDRDYRPEPPKPRPSAEKRSVEPPVSKPRPTPKPVRTVIKAASSKKLPTPTMISDFSGVPPKVYPHTCSLCDMQCDQEKDWLEHLETVNHTAACRHLRTKYPNWKPKVSSREYGARTVDHKRHSAGQSRSTSWSPPPPLDKSRGPAYKPRGKAYAPHHVPRHHPYHSKDFDGRYERPHSHSGSHLRRPTLREPWEKRDLPEGSSRMYLKRPHYDTKRLTSFKGEFTKKTMTKYKSGLKHETTKQADDGPPTKKKKVAPPLVTHGPECLVYLTDIPKEATEQEVINLAGSFGSINNVLMMPIPDEEEQKDQCQQASVCMMKAEDAQTFANAPNLLIRDRVITATVAKIPEDEQSVFADGSEKLEQDGTGGDQVPEKKGVVLIEDLPETGWTEEDLKSLAEPFGYTVDIIAAKRIGKAVVIFPDIPTAVEIVKVHAFSPLTINGHKLKIELCNRNVSISTPVALYNCFMQSVKPKGTTWSMLIVVSNVPETPSAASVVHKLVSRIGTVFRSLAVKNLVICEMANGPLGSAVYRHYLKFPCMIQNNPLVFLRKPDPKPTSKVIPAFLDADKDVPENKKEAETTPPANQKETFASSEPQDEMLQDVEMKSEQTEVEVTVTEANEEIKETIEQVKEESEHTELKDIRSEEISEDVKTETPNQPTDASVKVEAEGTSPKENGTQIQPAEDAKAVTTNEGEAPAQETATKAKEPTQAVSSDQKPQVKSVKKLPASVKKQASTEQGKEPTKNSNSSREVERRRAEREKLERERESRNKERRERDRVRKEREHEERNKHDGERERRGDPRREEMRRDWRRDWERREGRRKSYEEGDRRRGDSSKRSHYREDREDRYRSSGKKDTAEEEEDFPFNLSDFVTVDEVGDVDNEADDPNAPTETAPEPGPETEEWVQVSEPSQEHLQEADEVTPVNPAEPGEAETEEITEVKTDAEEQELRPETDTETKDTSAPVVALIHPEVKEEEQTTVEHTSEVPDAPGPAAAVETSETHQEESDPPQQDVTPEAAAKTTEEEEDEENKEEEVVKEPTAEKEDTQETETEKTSAPPAAKLEMTENGVKDITESTGSNSSDNSLPPFNPNNPVGMEYLVPMTGFFCKVCTRFFTGAKDTQISHSKSLKHYENFEKFLKSRQTSTSTADAGST